MINLAGDSQCDERIEKELEEAGILLLRLPVTMNREVPSSILGHLHGWTFSRSWYYWVAEATLGTCLPFALAEQLYEQNKSVRVGGHCGSPSPREYYAEPYFIGVPLYHIDTQEGLNVLAQYIARHAAREQGGEEE